MILRSLNVACIGAGVIGSGWVARLVLNGVNVTVFDKQKGSYKRTKEIIERAAMEGSFMELPGVIAVPDGLFKLVLHIEQPNTDDCGKHCNQ